MSRCDEHIIRAGDDSSTFLTSMTLQDNATMSNHCVFHKFKLQRSWILTIVTHLFTEEILQIADETNFTRADG